ncbi:AMP-binding protein [Methyloversatilis sp.]|uniref:AMP-binding protein n=1 Tax=Methyloversatilis sp. TaxID=2569862 RepID=UPI002737697A|nr:AMP-binding protein [Methyloversatilis sp.]MDP2870060.1 AMP-binding protein [Methyloversatilis sp.]MDP3454858.1 AMP-binding protein [Methyloversatilis sp.]MDP3576984.1 AMP-binding protein [Methyloversatilis sp.]
MKPVWLARYPAGVPAEVDVRRYASLVDLFKQSCRKFHDRPAFTSMGTTLSYAETDRLARDFAAYLQSLGLEPGARVAIMLPNLLQYPVALFGCLRAGLVVVNVNPLYTARELAHQLVDSGAVAIVVIENFAHVLQEVVAETAVRHIVTTQIGDLFAPVKRCLLNLAVKHVRRMVPFWRLPGSVPFRSALKLGAGVTERAPVVSAEDIAFLQYTGGTTGVAKGAVLTHGNLVANVEQTSAWIGITLREGEEVIITPLPLYHIFALTANLLTFVRWGANNVLIANPRDLPGFIKTLCETRFTAITGVTTLYRMLLDAPGFVKVKQANGDALKVAVAGGMALHPVVAERWQKLMGVPLIEGYGLTEASPIVCANPMNIDGYTGSIGLPLPSTEVMMRGEDGRESTPGEPGELFVRGPQVMRGYWNMPEETARVRDADGWLATGDVVTLDDTGFLHFVDRRKEMIVVSGFKVWPSEVEEVLLGLPGIREACVTSVPDEKSGESVCAWVVSSDTTLTERRIIDACHTQLTHYKVPRRIVFRDSLPKSPIGKILRRKLTENGV